MDPSLPTDLPSSADPRAMEAHPLLNAATINTLAWHLGVGSRARALATPEASRPGAFVFASGYNRYGVLAAPPSGVFEDVHAFELVRATLPVKPFADVEWESRDCPGLEPERVVDLVLQQAQFFVFGREARVEISCATGESEEYDNSTKHSYHFVWPEWRVATDDLADFGEVLAARVELCCGHDVVDQSVYHLDHLMRMLYQTKEAATHRPLRPIRNSSADGADHLINAYGAGDGIVWTPPVKTPAQARAAAQRFQDTPAFRDLVGQTVRLLSDARANDDYDDWLHIGMALHHTGDEVGDADAFLADWIAFSQRSRKFKPGECERKWRGFGGRDGYTLGTLRKFAEQDDPAGYDDVRRAFGRLYYEENPVRAGTAADIEAALARFGGLTVATPDAPVVAVEPPTAPDAPIEPPTPDAPIEPPAQAATQPPTPAAWSPAPSESGASFTPSLARVEPSREVPEEEGMEVIDGLARELSNQTVADVIFEAHRGALWHVGKDKWFRWTGRKWEGIVDVNVHAYFVALAAKVRRRRAWWAAAAAGAEAAPAMLRQAENMIKDLTKVVASLNTTAFSKGAMEKLKSLASDTKFVEKLDVNPRLLGFDDGVYELETGTFRPMLPADMVSKSVGYCFPSDETVATYRPLVDKILDDIFEDPGMKNYVLRLYGEQLDGRMRMELILILTGRGGNGKGILADLLKMALGEAASDASGGYFREVPAALWTQTEKNPEAANPVMLALKGTRMVMAQEPEVAGESKLQVGNLKSYSGNGTRTVRALYGDPITFKPTGSLSFQCNEIPSLSRMDGGIQRRLRVVPFKFLFKMSQEDIDADNSGAVCKLGDPNLKGRIALDPGFGQAFLMMLLDSYAANKDANDIPQPGEAAAATSRYITENSKVGVWLDEFYNRTGNDADRVPAADLLVEYANDTGDGRMNKNDFAKELMNANVKKTRSKAGYEYLGIKRKVEGASA